MTAPGHELSLDHGKCRVAIGDPDTPGFVLLTIALWAFKDRVFGDPESGVDPMDPAEMWAEFNEMFGTWVPEEGENKLNALITALSSPSFYKDKTTFMAVSNALYDGDLGDMIDGVFEEPSVVEMMWATLEVELARDDDDPAPPFSPQVADFLAAKLREEQEDHSMHEAAVNEAFVDMLDLLREIGVPLSALRLLNAEYAEVREAMDSAADGGAISPYPVA
jgi:hypothetical protein